VGRSVQNSGVALVAEPTCFQRGDNANVIIGNKTYHGIIKEIVELNYNYKGNIVLFKCD
jgi:alpha/beta superfamily hydrolase